VRRKRRKLQLFYNIHKLKLFQFLWIPNPTVIPYFTGIFKKWSNIHKI
jgi:hypothetical protein